MGIQEVECWWCHTVSNPPLSFHNNPSSCLAVSSLHWLLQMAPTDGKQRRMTSRQGQSQALHTLHRCLLCAPSHHMLTLQLLHKVHGYRSPPWSLPAAPGRAMEAWPCGAEVWDGHNFRLTNALQASLLVASSQLCVLETSWTKCHGEHLGSVLLTEDMGLPSLPSACSLSEVIISESLKSWNKGDVKCTFLPLGRWFSFSPFIGSCLLLLSPGAREAQERRWGVCVGKGRKGAQ